MAERRGPVTTVTGTTWLTPSMVRVVVGGPDLEGFGAGTFTDHYVKSRFGDKTRSYTVRAWDAERCLLTLDFVVHGDRGLAGPCAARARPGPVFAVVELDGPEHRQPLDSPGDLQVVWLDRHAGPGEDPSLQLETVKALELPGGQGHAFVHGEATMVRLIRRHLVVERGLPVEWLSASGYWKLRRADEQWRAEKRDWIALAEADLAGHVASS
jgi:NADPH-dependent ferric siderophore reductase